MRVGIHMNTHANLYQKVTYFQSSSEWIQETYCNFLINPETEQCLQKLQHWPNIEKITLVPDMIN